MSEAKQRSGIFKFFYVILSVITFPIFAVFFILRHPLWILFILLILAGGAYYYPISQEGVKPEEVIAWYQKKYSDVKIEVVNKAIESGTTDYLPKAVLDDVKKIEADAKEAQMPKSENYNDKIVRDSKGEETKIMIKKRGGFKKKNAVSEESNDSSEPQNKSDADVLVDEVAQTGGLSLLLKGENETAEEKLSGDVNESGESVKDVADETENEPVVAPENPAVTAPEVKLDKPILPAPVAEPEKPAVPVPASEEKAPVTSDDDLELDLF